MKVPHSARLFTCRRRAVVQLRELCVHEMIPMAALSTLADCARMRMADKSTMVAAEAVQLLREIAKLAGGTEESQHTAVGAVGQAQQQAQVARLDSDRLRAAIEVYETEYKVKKLAIADHVTLYVTKPRPAASMHVVTLLWLSNMGMPCCMLACYC